VLLRKSRRTRN
ncbi:hypothetical protein D046_6589B, partial [Vibrio parahaemolyticus V-223/04]